MTAPTCAACSRPVGDQARLCSSCTHRLARDLGDLAALAEELETTRRRLSRTGGAATGVLSRSHDKPLPWDQNAAEVADALRATTVGWVRVLLEQGRSGRGVTDTITSMAAFLLANLEALRHHDAADEVADEFADCTARAWQAIDRATPWTYAGPCREEVPEHVVPAKADEGEDEEHGPSCCVAELHAREGARTVICRACQARHDAYERRQWLLRIAENQLVPAADLPAILSTSDRRLSLNTVKSWIHRKRLLPHGSSDPALYRVGDAVDLIYPSSRRTA